MLPILASVCPATHIHGCCVQVVASGQQAGKLVGQVARLCGGGGGGKPALAQAGGKDASKLQEALELAKNTLLGSSS